MSNAEETMSDYAFAEQLGTRVKMIRQSIRRHKEHLEHLGPLTVLKTMTPKGGRPDESYQLTRKHVLYLTNLSRSPDVTPALKEQIKEERREDFKQAVVQRILSERQREKVSQLEVKIDFSLGDVREAERMIASAEKVLALPKDLVDAGAETKAKRIVSTWNNRKNIAEVRIEKAVETLTEIVGEEEAKATLLAIKSPGGLANLIGLPPVETLAIEHDPS